MSRHLFVTGMIRSGTSLVQVLLTNHPQAFVAYQPFHQLHVDVKRLFLEECGRPRALPLGDGMGEDPAEAAAFLDWLQARRFTADEARRLAYDAVTGKGGSAVDLAGTFDAPAGTFFELRAALLQQLAAHFGHGDRPMVGSKEVLCEEYLPALLDAQVRAVAVVRDPRAVVASANHGRYLDLVGDRYPLLMLVRLWRKSVAHALRARSHPLGQLVRYEDVATDPASSLDGIARGLGLDPFPEGLMDRPLLDHTGQPWTGNSSFGDKPGVDVASTMAWRSLLDPGAARFVEACTHPELRALGYATDLAEDEARAVIGEYIEDEAGVRAGYLELYGLTPERREQELQREPAERMD